MAMFLKLFLFTAMVLLTITSTTALTEEAVKRLLLPPTTPDNVCPWAWKKECIPIARAGIPDKHCYFYKACRDGECCGRNRSCRLDYTVHAFSVYSEKTGQLTSTLVKLKSNCCCLPKI